MPRDHSDEQILSLLIARRLALDPERLTLRGSPARSFNKTYFVGGGPKTLTRPRIGRRDLRRRFAPATGP